MKSAYRNPQVKLRYLEGLGLLQVDMKYVIIKLIQSFVIYVHSFILIYIEKSCKTESDYISAVLQLFALL